MSPQPKRETTADLMTRRDRLQREFLALDAFVKQRRFAETPRTNLRLLAKPRRNTSGAHMLAALATGRKYITELRLVEGFHEEVLHRLLRRGMILRIRQGVYEIAPVEEMVCPE